MAVGLGVAGLASANARSPEYEPYQRYIDAGNLGGPITVGERTWEPQVGFTGGTLGTTADPRPGHGLPPEVAGTVLTGATAFSLAVPKAKYRVSLWVRRPARGVATIAAEGAVRASVRARTVRPTMRPVLRQGGRTGRLVLVTVPVRVEDGALDLAFQPEGNRLQIAALAVEGRVRQGEGPPPPPVTPTATGTTASPTTPPVTASPTETVPPTTEPPTTTKPPTTTAPPTTTPPTTEPPSRTCTNPKFVTSDTNGGWDDGGYYVHNNMWNASEGGPETLYACAYNNWYVTSTQPDTTSVKTYPNVHKDYNDVPIQSFKSLRSTFAATSPHTGIYNVAYDIWTNGVASANSTEFMIWTENFNQRPAGSVAATVTLGGRVYDVWKTSNNKYIAFVPKTPMTSGSLDLLEIFNWTIGKGWLPASSTVGQIDFGVEICSTKSKPATFQFTDFSITSS